MKGKYLSQTFKRLTSGTTWLKQKIYLKLLIKTIANIFFKRENSSFSCNIDFKNSWIAPIQ